MKNLFISVIIAFIASFAINAQDTNDVIYLNNGSVIQGTITNIKENKSVTIVTLNGEKYTYQMVEVRKIDQSGKGVKIPYERGKSEHKAYSKFDQGFFFAVEGNGGYSLNLSGTNIGFGEIDFVGGYRVNDYFRIGAGFGQDFDVKDINYDKVIIMTDADDDGAHIQCLLLTFFYRFMKPLIEEGHLYIAMPPLYKVDYGKNHTYCWTNEELKEATKGKQNYKVQRYKGLGEMNPEPLWTTTMDPENRNLIKVNITDALLAEKRVSVLMGDLVEPRKDWINENVEFSLEDDYIIETTRN